MPWVVLYNSCWCSLSLRLIGILLGSLLRWGCTSCWSLPCSFTGGWVVEIHALRLRVGMLLPAWWQLRGRLWWRGHDGSLDWRALNGLTCHSHRLAWLIGIGDGRDNVLLKTTVGLVGTIKSVCPRPHPHRSD